MPPPASPDPRLLDDFFVPGDATLGALAEIYGLQVAADHTDVTLADFFTEHLGRRPRPATSSSSARSRCWRTRSTNGRVTTVGLRLAEPEEPADLVGRAQVAVDADCRSGSA